MQHSQLKAWQAKKVFGEDYPYFVLWSLCRNRAIQKKIQFELTIDNIKDQFLKQRGKCTYTYQTLVLPKNFYKHGMNASIDRIDSKLGYIVGNIQFVTIKVNYMKYNMSHEQFLQLCHLIAAAHP